MRRQRLSDHLPCAIMACVAVCMSLVLGCGRHAYPDMMVTRAELEGKDKSWFLKNWGQPSGKALRFFGGETWTYLRIAGDRAGPAIFNFSPTACQVTLKFDDEDRVHAIDTSGC